MVDLPQTGETTCYDAAGTLIDCPGTGQDGDVRAGGGNWPEARFTDNNDGTLTDNLTGLVWLRNANCNGYIYWDDALTWAKTLADGACGLTDGSAAGGWRLPNILELESLVNVDEPESCSGILRLARGLACLAGLFPYPVWAIISLHRPQPRLVTRWTHGRLIWTMGVT